MSARIIQFPARTRTDPRTETAVRVEKILDMILGMRPNHDRDELRKSLYELKAKHAASSKP